MKQKLLVLLCLFLPLSAWCQDKDVADGKAAAGRWFTDGHDGIVNLYIEENQLKGQIVWINTD